MASMHAMADAASPRPATPHRTFKHLQLRFSYSSQHPPPDADAWFNRHRDLPCVFRGASAFLWQQDQATQIDELFHHEWQSDATSPLHSLCGNLRRCSSTSHQNVEKTMQRAMSVATFLQRRDKDESLVLSDVSLAALPQAASFVRGPSLLAPFNLLTDLPVGRETQTHLICEMILGTKGSYTGTHQDFYGADAFLHLVQGDKVWLCAPPEKRAQFIQLFGCPEKDGHSKGIRVSLLTAAEQQFMMDHQIFMIEQHADDVVFMPGGWIHAVKNRTHTVAFGNSYIRPWKLNHTLDHILLVGWETAVIRVNIQALFQWVFQHEEFILQMGVTKASLDAIRARCKSTRAFVRLLRASSSSASSAAATLARLATTNRE